MSWIEKIEQYDQELMLQLNGAHTGWLDFIMVWASKPLLWLPVYLLVVFLIYKKWGVKYVLITLLCGGLVVFLGDRISVMAFKDVFMRFRPCHNGDIGHLIHTVNDYCGGQYGFISSHSTNFFGLAVLLAGILRTGYKIPYMLLLPWAGVIGYSRIYLGVHYPADVVCGGLLGSAIGFTVLWFYKFAQAKDKG